MSTQSPEGTGRSATMMAPPVRLDPAFEDLAAIRELIVAGAPYKTITAVHKEPPNDTTPGWFRNFWALGGKVIFPRAESAFYNPRFIAAAKQTFRAEIIEPLAMMTNFNVPAPASPPHLDLPFFRGAHEREVPSWLLAPMGYSGLFQAWAIPVASAITWIYEGEGGDFHYWADGIASPPSVVSKPYTNTSVLADNEYMYHRVGQTGAAADYLAKGLSSEALLHRVGHAWEIRHGEELVRCYRDDQIRISILWKAFCFKNREEADRFRDPHYNLTPTKIVDIFCEDLGKRGITLKAPSDLATDRAWMQAILAHYPPALKSST